MKPVLKSVVLWALVVVMATGCRAPECQQMLECCSVVEDRDEVGGACVDLAQETRDPQTCRDILRTIGYMLEDRDEAIPEPCHR